MRYLYALKMFQKFIYGYNLFFDKDVLELNLLIIPQFIKFSYSKRQKLKIWITYLNWYFNFYNILIKFYNFCPNEILQYYQNKCGLHFDAVLIDRVK